MDVRITKYRQSVITSVRTQGEKMDVRELRAWCVEFNNNKPSDSGPIGCKISQFNMCNGFDHRRCSSHDDRRCSSHDHSGCSNRDESTDNNFDHSRCNNLVVKLGEKCFHLKTILHCRGCRSREYNEGDGKSEEKVVLWCRRYFFNVDDVLFR